MSVCGGSRCATIFPFYVPATATIGLKLAGAIGDGVILNAVCSPEYTVNALKIIKDSAEQAGRDFSKFEVAQIINCSIEDDHKKALDAVRWEVATKLDPVQISFIAAPKMRVGEPYIRKEDIPLFEKAHAQGGMEGSDQGDSRLLRRRHDRQRHAGRSEEARAAIPRRRRQNSSASAGCGASDADFSGLVCA